MFFVVVLFNFFSFVNNIFIFLKTNQFIIMKSKLLLITFILISTLGYSQMLEISGKVIDSKSNTPLVGVNVEF